ncbi:MAG: VWA domain-containing protein [Deltaproteobacteria bacterium]|nr:VWA domain-containing protein [Deltaproteobacteria bacterium]
MRNRSHPRMAVVLCLAATLVARAAESEEDRTLIEMEPARAAQEALAPIIAGPPGSVAIDLETPEDGTIFVHEPIAHLWGRLDTLGRVGRVDAIALIDTSESTARYAELRNRVRDRHRGRFDPWKKPPSVLDHEVRSVETLLRELDPRDTRVGVVTFAGGQDDAAYDRAANTRVEVPLTGRLEAVDAGLQRVIQRGAAGRTDMAAGVDRAVAELTGAGVSQPDAAAAKVIVFFTDGTPTLPYAESSENERAVFDAADRAAAAGVRIFSFAIGPEALRRPIAATEIARRTDGVYTPVRQPSQLAEAVTSTVKFTGVGGELLVRNATLRANAIDLHVADDGIFGGIVPLQPGKNRIFIRAVAGNRNAEVMRSVHYAPGSFTVYEAPRIQMPPVPWPSTRRELELGRSGQQRSLELTLNDQRKELEIGLGDLQRKKLDVGLASGSPGPAAPSRAR